jgi:NADH-quinone oxidoreductase subunit M
MNYLLPSLLAVPIFGAIIAAVLPRVAAAKGWALGVAVVTAILAVVIAVNFPYYQTKPDVFEPGAWLSFGPGAPTLSIGVDAISLCLVLLTVVLVPLAIASTFGTPAITGDRPRQFYAWMLALLAAMLGVFLARDLLLFYAFFELTLVPSFFLIGIWGGPERREAATKFFLYTFAASVFTLAAIVYLGARAGSFDIDAVVRYAQHTLTGREQFWIALGLLSAFVVKSAVFPVHTWLPITYTEAPTAGTVILAGVMPKLGTYGILRLVLPIGLVTNGTDGPTPFHGISAVIGILCVAGILYGALIAWVQKDVKRLLAYSSFSHLGFCVLGLMAVDSIGAQGSLLYMVNHGISTGALFLMAGMIFDRFATHDRTQIGGLAKSMPRFAFFLVLFAMSSIGLPGLNGFASEFLTLLGTFGVSSPSGTLVTRTSQLGPWFGGAAALGMILAAVYMLAMVNGLLFGPAKVPTSKGSIPPGDLSGRELAILSPLAVLVVVLGVYPMAILRPTLAPVEAILRPAVAEDGGGEFAAASHVPAPPPLIALAGR